MKFATRTALALLLCSAHSAADAADVTDLPDPTRPLGGHMATPKPAAPPATPAPPVLQSILLSPQRRLAMINGRTVSVGEQVGDAQVVEILPYEVVLKRGAQEVRLRLVMRLNKQPANSGKE